MAIMAKQGVKMMRTTRRAPSSSPAASNGLALLLDPQRGEDAPHPFYVNDAKVRADVVEFLKGLDTFH